MMLQTGEEDLRQRAFQAQDACACNLNLQRLYSTRRGIYKDPVCTEVNNDSKIKNMNSANGVK